MEIHTFQLQEWRQLPKKKLEEALLSQLPQQLARAETLQLKREAKGKTQHWQEGYIDEKLSLYGKKLRGDLEELDKRFNAFVAQTSLKELVCPFCNEADKENRFNGKPWCFKCNVPLVRKDLVKKFSKIRVISKHDSTPGLYGAET